MSNIYSEEELQELAEDILQGVDYDIYKEDLEECILIDEISMKIANFVDSVIRNVE